MSAEPGRSPGGNLTCFELHNLRAKYESPKPKQNTIIQISFFHQLVCGTMPLGLVVGTNDPTWAPLPPKLPKVRRMDRTNQQATTIAWLARLDSFCQASLKTPERITQAVSTLPVSYNFGK